MTMTAMSIAQRRARRSKVPTELLIKDMRKCARKTGKKSVTGAMYGRDGFYSLKQIYRRFGSWSNAIRAAGLTTNKVVDIPDAALFANLADVWRKLGRQPVGSDLDKESGGSRFSVGTYEKRFGSWNGSLRAFSDFSAKTDTGAKPIVADKSPQACDEREVSAYDARSATFQIKLRRRNIPKDIIVEDLLRVAGQAAGKSVTAAEYSHKGRFGVNTILRRFGSWNNALTAAGLRINTVPCIPDEALFANLAEVFRKLGRLPVGNDLDKANCTSRFVSQTVEKRFGTCNSAVRQAGLPATDQACIPDAGPFAKVADVSRELPRLPRGNDLQKHNGTSRFALSTYEKRFGSWNKALGAFSQFSNSTEAATSATTTDKSSPVCGQSPKPICGASANPPFYIELRRRGILRQVLIDDLRRVAGETGGRPVTSALYTRTGRFGVNTMQRRFGSWKEALGAADLPVDALASKSHPRRTPRNIGWRLRARVLIRDNCICCMCGASPAKDPAVTLHVDHIVPWSKGGETVIDNLQTLCSPCNVGKSDDAATVASAEASSTMNGLASVDTGSRDLQPAGRPMCTSEAGAARLRLGGEGG